MTILALEIDDPFPVEWYAFNKLQREVETVLGKVTDITTKLSEKRQILQSKNQIKDLPELAKQERYQKMINTALFSLEIYILYALPIAIVSTTLSNFIPTKFANGVDGIITSLLFGGGIGRCLQIFAQTFYNIGPLYDCQCESHEYEGLRYEAFSHLKVIKEKVDLFSNSESIEEELNSLKVRINTLTLDLLERYPYFSLLGRSGSISL